MTISLHEIQFALKKLWIDTESCSRYMACESSDCCSDEGYDKLCHSADRQGVWLYTQLIRLGWHDVMSSIYPLTEELLSVEWCHTVDNYLKVYPPRHFNLNQLANRFSCFLAAHEKNLLKRYPFIAELADYEWLELEVLEDLAVVPEPLLAVEQLIGCQPIVNPTVRTRRYQYPLPEIANLIECGECTSTLPTQEKQTWMLAYRTSQSNACRIIEVSELVFMILEAAKAKGSTYDELAVQAINLCEGSLPKQDAVLQFIDLIEKLHEMNAFVGQCIPKEPTTNQVAVGNI